MGRNSTLDRRNVLKGLATSAIGSVFGIQTTQPARADVCCDQWPQKENHTYEAYNDDISHYETSASTHVDFLDSAYLDGKWLYKYEVETSATCILNRDDPYDDDRADALDGGHSIDIVETYNADDFDMMHGQEEWNIGSKPSKGTSVEYAEAVYDIAEAVVSYYSAPVGALTTASDIVGSYTDATGDEDSTKPISHRWDGLYGRDEFSHYLRWIVEVKPKEETGNDSHRFQVTDNVWSIPNHTEYEYRYAEFKNAWEIDTGSMYSPSTMSTSEERQYGIQYVPANELAFSTQAFDDVTAPDDLVPVARTPPVTITKLDVPTRVSNEPLN